jgi:hypothetical protein
VEFVKLKAKGTSQKHCIPINKVEVQVNDSEAIIYTYIYIYIYIYVYIYIYIYTHIYMCMLDVNNRKWMINAGGSFLNVGMRKNRQQVKDARMIYIVMD